jgi:hypothetical protein
MAGRVFPSGVGKAILVHYCLAHIKADNMNQETNHKPPKPRSKSGRPAKAAQDKASHTVGPYCLTPAEKQEFDRLFKASRLDNQAKFFRQVMFSNTLKLYYSDENSLMISARMKEIQSDLRRIGKNYNQAVKALNTVYKGDIRAGEEAAKLVALTGQLSVEFKIILALFREYKALSSHSDQSTDRNTKEKGQ